MEKEIDALELWSKWNIQNYLSNPEESKDKNYSKKQQKRILKDIAYEHIPKTLLDRPKSGFVPPISQWLKNDLKDWAIDLLNNYENQDGLIDIEFGKLPTFPSLEIGVVSSARRL